MNELRWHAHIMQRSVDSKIQPVRVRAHNLDIWIFCSKMWDSREGVYYY